MVKQANDEIIFVLSRIIDLLEKTGDYDWAFFFKDIKKDLMRNNNQKEVIKKIYKSFGGMGSFNDLVLQKDMKMLTIENDLLDEYRHLLFELCEKIIKDEPGSLPLS